MSWFDRMKKGFMVDKQRELPDSMWTKCEGCGDMLVTAKLSESLWVCPKCGYHFRISAKDYLGILFDENSFTEMNANLTSADPLKFRDSKRYTDRLKEARSKTKIQSAIITGTGKMENIRVAGGIMEFQFIAGTLGSVMGEKIARLIDTAIKEKLPLIIVSRSGGARMQESTLSLMQMAKTSAKIGQLHCTGLPYISILTHPTTGGTTASFAMLGDVHIAEPNALIGFAGPRVIEAAIQRPLPDGFQRSKFVLEHGFVDMIVPRTELKHTIVRFLRIIGFDREYRENTKATDSKKEPLFL